MLSPSPPPVGSPCRFPFFLNCEEADDGDGDGDDDDGEGNGKGNGKADGKGDGKAPLLPPSLPPPLGPGRGEPLLGDGDAAQSSSGGDGMSALASTLLVLFLLSTVLLAASLTLRSMWRRRKQGDPHWWELRAVATIRALVAGATHTARPAQAEQSNQGNAWLRRPASVSKGSVRLGDGVEYKADRLPNAAAADGAAAADAGEKKHRPTADGAASAMTRQLIFPSMFAGDTREWFYMGLTNLEHGPVSSADLQRMHGGGGVHDLTYVWCDSMDGWLPLGI